MFETFNVPGMYLANAQVTIRNPLLKGCKDEGYNGYLFATFNLPGILSHHITRGRIPTTPTKYVQVLALLASGRTTGLVLDSGLEETRAVPVYQGQ